MPALIPIAAALGIVMIAGGLTYGASQAENTVAEGTSNGLEILAVAGGAALIIYAVHKSHHP